MPESLKKRILKQAEPLPPDFFLPAPEQVAPLLLGKILLRTFSDGMIAGGRILEVEAYGPGDPASHSFKGPGKRNRAMFGQGGTAYVYISYGIHHCFNVVTGFPEEGSAVLIRALQPLWGLKKMAARRGKAGKNLCNGPGKLCQALGIETSLNFHDLSVPPLQILEDDCIPEDKHIVQTGRIGITKAAELPWRFLWNNPAGKF